MKELKDYLHLYLGCEFMGYDNRIQALTPDNFRVVVSDKWRPVLRPLIGITNEEKKELWGMIFKREFPNSGRILFFKERSLSAEPRWVLMSGVDRLGIELNGDIWADCDLHHVKFNPHELTARLLKKGFDLFGLIESGLAIDKTTIKQNA